MKKSKILVPALGILVLSTAAAVSGTVAWFAASRTATVGVTNNTIINPEGVLNCDLAAGHITTVADDGKSVAIEENHKLRDASVDINAAIPGTSGVDPTVYRAHVDEKGAILSYEKVNYDAAYNVTDNVYYCATWTMTFTLDGTSSSEFDIFFDGVSSSYTINTKATESNYDAIHNSYRLGFFTADRKLVWAPKAAGDTVTYTNGLTAASTSTYTRIPAAKITETSFADATEAKASPNYLGTICGKDSGVEGKTQLLVGCVAWFEGNDPQCIASNLAAGITSTATASIVFNAVEEAAYDVA